MAKEEKKTKAAPKGEEGQSDAAQAAAPKDGGKKAKAPKEGSGGKKGAEKKGEKAPAPEEKLGPPRLKVEYQKRVVPRLMERFGYTNLMQVPRLQKIVINMGVGETIQNPKAIDGAMNDMQLIAGQKPNIRRARKSVSNFKLRAGIPIGCAVTLRRARMWEFLDRLMTFAIPRIRDFRGIPRRGFDGRGNFTFGLKEQLIFPEIDYDTVDQIRGMDVSIVTTARTDEEGFELLSELGMPFVRQS